MFGFVVICRLLPPWAGEWHAQKCGSGGNSGTVLNSWSLGQHPGESGESGKLKKTDDLRKECGIVLSLIQKA